MANRNTDTDTDDDFTDQLTMQELNRLINTRLLAIRYNEGNIETLNLSRLELASFRIRIQDQYLEIASIIREQRFYDGDADTIITNRIPIVNEIEQRRDLVNQARRAEYNARYAEEQALLQLDADTELENMYKAIAEYHTGDPEFFNYNGANNAIYRDAAGNVITEQQAMNSPGVLAARAACRARLLGPGN